MYYLKIGQEDANSLIYYCRNCGYEDTTLTASNICVSETHIKKNEQQYSHIINEYTKQDPTLPRINTIRCPNQECKSNNDEGNKGKGEREVIYIRYDDTNMKYIYICAKCDTMWKTDEQK
jgi:DNA-directed RNA polymerase subunit M/transcription elongation factor TFIIS